MATCNEKIKCELCGQEITRINYTKHLRRHKNHPESFNKTNGKYKLNHDGLICQFCGKECKNRSSLCNHERLCKSNPDYQPSPFIKYNKEKQSAWNKGLTKETDDRVKKQSESLSNAINSGKVKNQGGFKKYSAQKCKYGTYQGYYCDSGWELAVLIYCLDKNIPIKRNSQPFEYYTKDNKKHKYYPDFIINGEYTEIKGRYTENDYIKIESFKKYGKLNIIDSSNINVYINYAISIYGKDFTSMYDRNFPCWMDKIDFDKKYNFKTNIN